MNYRHGDLCLVSVNKLPDGLKASKSKVLMTGSGGNDHVVKGGTVYPVEGQPFIIGYLVADKGVRTPESPFLGKYDAVAHRMDRIGAIGNGQVPSVVARAWALLVGEVARTEDREG